jgi:hypothetical protein
MQGANGAARHSTAQQSTARRSTAQHSRARGSTVQHSTAQHGAAQHSTAQHSSSSGDTQQARPPHLSHQEEADKGHVLPPSSQRLLGELGQRGPVALGCRQQQEAAQVLSLAEALGGQVQLAAREGQLAWWWWCCREMAAAAGAGAAAAVMRRQGDAGRHACCVRRRASTHNNTPHQAPRRAGVVAF